MEIGGMFGIVKVSKSLKRQLSGKIKKALAGLEIIGHRPLRMLEA